MADSLPVAADGADLLRADSGLVDKVAGGLGKVLAGEGVQFANFIRVGLIAHRLQQAVAKLFRIGQGERAVDVHARSEERRVGKECRLRCWRWLCKRK